VCDVTLGDGAATLRVAGHPAPVISSAGDARYADVTVGPPLGVSLPGAPQSRWPGTRIPLSRDATVLLYTDGLLDAYAEAGADSLGIGELVAAVDKCTREGVEARTWLPNLVGRAPREAADDTAAVVLTIAEGR